MKITVYQAALTLAHDRRFYDKTAVKTNRDFSGTPAKSVEAHLEDILEENFAEVVAA